MVAKTFTQRKTNWLNAGAIVSVVAWMLLQMSARFEWLTITPETATIAANGILALIAALFAGGNIAQRSATEDTKKAAMSAATAAGQASFEVAAKRPDPRTQQGAF